jgi:FHA domain-containing protein
MYAMSSPPGPAHRPSPALSSRPPSRRVVRSFLCHDDLWRVFEERATALECSVDWLLGEAMKRMLESGPRPEPSAGSARPQHPFGCSEAARTSRPPPLPANARRPERPPLAPPPRRVRTTAPDPPRAAPSGIMLVGGGRRAVVDRDRFVIGRSAREAHLVLRHRSVSRQHAIIERSGDGFVIVDVASTNGVEVNGSRVTRAALRAGDILTIGPFAIVVATA